ncbi:MAG: alpha/beta fold hydrolase [Pseudomonadota bacterium]
MLRWLVPGMIALGLAGCETRSADPAPVPSTPVTDITVEAADGVTVFGTIYFGSLPETAPLILLFHQGGSNARAEYEPLIPWLNEAGYRAIGWDLRPGGDIFGLNNRTVDAMLPAKAQSYCEGYPDMQAALEASLALGQTDDAIIWGSSFSAALVFHLAADAPDQVSRVIAASPASGPPMAECLARARLDDLTVPAFVLRPASEMQGESAQAQKALMEAAGIPVLVLEDGVHGASMLVDSRTESDMSEARATLIEWLSE